MVGGPLLFIIVRLRFVAELSCRSHALRTAHSSDVMEM